MRNTVDLPQPDGPSRARNSPGRPDRFTSCNAVTDVPRDRNVLARPVISMPEPAWPPSTLRSFTTDNSSRGLVTFTADPLGRACCTASADGGLPAVDLLEDVTGEQVLADGSAALADGADGLGDLLVAHPEQAVGVGVGALNQLVSGDVFQLLFL